MNIKILSENLINKIAAGEVIERPASVVKELLENAIDAGAKNITLIVKNGGSNLIQVIDDGCGLSEEDTIMSFQRHATSKIFSYEDVQNINTLGFRGEALASIAAVSRVEMKTVLQGAIEGTSIQIEGGVVQKVEKTGGNPGTSIAVKNLFFNTPARRKFLHTETSEYRQILRVFNRFALGHPEMALVLYNDDREIARHAPCTLKARIIQVLGPRTQNNLIEIEAKTVILDIAGYIGNADLMRKTRNDQYLFLNNRIIEDNSITFAVKSAFGDYIPKGQHPLFVLSLTIDPKRVDVNVHPTKNRVKFADQQSIFNIIRAAVKQALRSDHMIPDMGEAGTHESLRFEKPLLDEIKSFTPMATNRASYQSNYQTQLPLTEERDIPDPLVTPAFTSRAEATKVWQVHNKYLLAQIKSGLVIIDQHVAHERILYEQAKNSFKEKSASQQLLFPQTIELSGDDFENMMEILPLLEKIGFIIKGFGGKTVVVEGIPSGLRVGKEDKMLLEILDEYKIKQDVDVRERVAKSYSCRMAIMSGDRLTPEVMNSLIDQLFTTENPYFCPHGRPIMTTITVDELDKRFERK